MLEKNTTEYESAVLIGVITQLQDEEQSKEYLDELEFLTYTAGGEVLKRFTQKLEHPNPKTFINSGKLETVRQFIEEHEVGSAIFDDELSPAQQKNIEAIASANQLAVEGMQAIGKRQAELFQQAVEESQKTLGELMTQGAPEDRIAKQAETVKATIERTVTNLREISEMLAKSNQEAFEVINKRITESLEEVQSLAGKK